MCAHLVFSFKMVLLAGAKFAHAAAAAPVDREHDLWLAENSVLFWCFFGQIVVKLVQNVCSPCVLSRGCARSWCQERKAGGECARRGCEVIRIRMWGGRVVRHRVNWWRSWHKVGQKEKLTTAAVYADHFGASSFLVLFCISF